MDFKSPKFNTVVEQALLLATGNPKWEKAIQRAADGLKRGDIIVTELASGCLVTTENGSYKIDAQCPCAAFQHGHRQCKHRAARRLCALYSEAIVNELAEIKAIEREVETRVIEYDRTGVSYRVVRCGGWTV
jgi:hypothetical protein